MTKPPKQTWDTRAWLLGILGGSFSAACFVMSFSPQIAARLDAALPGSSNWFGGVAGLITIVLLPALLSGLARRWTFFWGLIPAALLLVAAGSIAQSTHSWKSLSAIFWSCLLFLGVGWLISSGPVSLIRWLRVRAVRRQEAQMASYQAMRESAAVPQEGVWPPPPDYRG